MFYFTRNFKRQKLRLRKAKKISDADADVNAEMPMPRFPNGPLETLETFRPVT